MPKDAMQAEIEPKAFTTTRWSLIVAGSQLEEGEQRAREALAELCRTYWRPIFSFIYRRGHSAEDAQDLTQDFFVMILESNWLEHADESRGRFRSFLLRSVENFLGHAAERKQARKRGGDLKFVSWDEWMAEAPSEIAIAEDRSDSLAPQKFFEWRWATAVVAQALARLREECEGRGRLRLFETLSKHLSSERDEVSYARLATELGIAEAMVKKQLHNLRQRYRWLLRDEVAQTLNNPAEIDDEIRHLCAALAAQS